MLNEVQTRNYNRYQKLHLYLTEHGSVYNSYIPFSREVQSFTTHFKLFRSFVLQDGVNGIHITNSQRELKNKIALQVANICDMATAYAEQYNDEQLAAAVGFSRSDVLRFNDKEVYELVSSIINVLQPMLTDVYFMEYAITEEMLEKVMTDALTFSDNLEAAAVMHTRNSFTNEKIQEITRLLDKNVQQFDRLINKFASSHPEFVTGYHINSASENPVTYQAGIEGTIISEADGKPVSNAIVSVANKKEVITDNMGNFAIISLYGCDCEIAVAASGFVSKTAVIRVPRGRTVKLNIAL